MGLQDGRDCGQLAEGIRGEKLCRAKHIKVTETFLVKEDFKLVIKEDESCIVIDAETNKLVVVAIRNIVDDVLPKVVVKDFNGIDVPRMDFNRPEHERSGHYQIRRGEEVIEMAGEFAPAAALPGENYARFCHNESNANKFVMSLTTSRSVASTSDEGGHFYVASHGIKIRSAPDTLAAWKARDYHGTTLQRTTPLWAKKATGHYQQRGFAFLIQNRLPGLWRMGKIRELPQGKKWQVGQKVSKAIDDNSSEGPEHDTTDEEVKVDKPTDHAAKQQMKRKGLSVATVITIDSSSESEIEFAGESVTAQQNTHLPTARSSRLALEHPGLFRRVCKPVTRLYPSNHHAQYNTTATTAGPLPFQPEAAAGGGATTRKQSRFENGDNALTEPDTTNTMSGQDAFFQVPTTSSLPISGTATTALPVARSGGRVPSHPHISTTSATVHYTQVDQMIATDRALIARFDAEVEPHLGKDWEDFPWGNPGDMKEV
ncbi:MAG: hypothetical protein Q9201_005620 [Fulgogasparrea decipioides]